MKKNIIIIHLESLNNIIYRMNPQLFPNIRKVEEKSVSFRKYFSTATSTLMVMSDLIYGGMNQYEQCRELTEQPKTFEYDTGLLDDLYDRGYETSVFGYPYANDIFLMKKHKLCGNKVEIIEYSTYEVFWNAFQKAMYSDKKYAIYIANFLSNIGFNNFIEKKNKSYATQRWSDGYRFLDDMVGNIFELLAETQKSDNTIVLLYGDHGDDYWGHGFHMGLTHAIEPLTPLIHTPFMIWEKGKYHEQISEDLVSTVDIRDIVCKLADGSEVDLDRNRKYAFARSAFAAQPIRLDSFNKGYSITDGKMLLLVTYNGMEMYDIEMDPACGFNFLSVFRLEQDKLVFDEPQMNKFRYHFEAFMDANEKRYIRQKFYYLKAQLEREVKERYTLIKKDEEVYREMKFDRIHYNMQI